MKRIKRIKFLRMMDVANLFELFSGTDASASRNLDFALVLVELAHVLVDTLTQLIAIIFLASNSLFRVVFLFFVTVKLFPQFFCFFAKSVNSKMVNVEDLLVFSDPFLLDFTISLSLVWLVLFSSSQVSTIVKGHVCDCGLLPCLFLLPLLFFFFFSSASFAFFSASSFLNRSSSSFFCWASFFSCSARISFRFACFSFSRFSSSSSLARCFLHSLMYSLSCSSSSPFFASWRAFRKFPSPFLEVLDTSSSS